MGIKAKILKELQKKPRRLKELKAKLGNDKKVARAVDELVERNKVVCRKGVYAVPDPKTGNAVECTLVKLAGKFGFARPVQPDGQDIFIPGKYLMGAMPGDTLLVSLFEHPRVEGSSEGEVLAVVKENNRFTGTVETIEGRLALVPDACPHCPIYIKKRADGGARDGEKAAVEILERGDSHEDHRAGVAMRFGSAEEAKQCAKALLYGAGLSRHFPLKAKAEAKKYARQRRGRFLRLTRGVAGIGRIGTAGYLCGKIIPRRSLQGWARKPTAKRGRYENGYKGNRTKRA